MIYGQLLFRKKNIEVSREKWHRTALSEA